MRCNNGRLYCLPLQKLDGEMVLQSLGYLHLDLSLRNILCGGRGQRTN